MSTLSPRHSSGLQFTAQSFSRIILASPMLSKNDRRQSELLMEGIVLRRMQKGEQL
jgi:hypothetical protein